MNLNRIHHIAVICSDKDTALDLKPGLTRTLMIHKR